MKVSTTLKPPVATDSLEYTSRMLLCCATSWMRLRAFIRSSSLKSSGLTGPMMAGALVDADVADGVSVVAVAEEAVTKTLLM